MCFLLLSLCFFQTHAFPCRRPFSPRTPRAIKAPCPLAPPHACACRTRPPVLASPFFPKLTHSHPNQWCVLRFRGGIPAEKSWFYTYILNFFFTFSDCDAFTFFPLKTQFPLRTPPPGALVPLTDLPFLRLWIGLLLSFPEHSSLWSLTLKKKAFPSVRITRTQSFEVFSLGRLLGEASPVDRPSSESFLCLQSTNYFCSIYINTNKWPSQLCKTPCNYFIISEYGSHFPNSGIQKI